MLAGFTPQIELFLVLGASALFGTAAYFTRATLCRNVAALAATPAILILNVLWVTARTRQIGGGMHQVTKCLRHLRSILHRISFGVVHLP